MDVECTQAAAARQARNEPRTETISTGSFLFLLFPLFPPNFPSSQPLLNSPAAPRSIDVASVSRVSRHHRSPPIARAPLHTIRLRSTYSLTSLFRHNGDAFVAPYRPPRLPSRASASCCSLRATRSTIKTRRPFLTISIAKHIPPTPPPLPSTSLPSSPLRRPLPIRPTSCPLPL